MAVFVFYKQREIILSKTRYILQMENILSLHRTIILLVYGWPHPGNELEHYLDIRILLVH